MSRYQVAQRRGGGGGWAALVLAVIAVAGMLPDDTATPAPAAAAAPAPAVAWVPRASGPGVDGQPGSFEDYVSALAPPMQDAVRQLDAAMGGLRITSGYRSAAYQAQLCRRVAGPCAPPDRSMHQHGLAIDTPDWQAAVTALAANPQIPLCQPLPATDPVHLSHRDGSEC